MEKTECLFSIRLQARNNATCLFQLGEGGVALVRQQGIVPGSNRQLLDPLFRFNRLLDEGVHRTGQVRGHNSPVMIMSLNASEVCLDLGNWTRWSLCRGTHVGGRLGAGVREHRGGVQSAGEIGAKLGADFVLEIYLDGLRLYQPGTERNVYEARAEVKVSVYEAGAEGGAMKDKYDLAVAYPRTGVRPADAMSESAFKNLFVETMAIEVARQHVEHKASNSIADGR